MNFVKSLFIFITPPWLIYVVIQVSNFGVVELNSILSSIGIVLSALPLLIFLSYIMLFQKLARTSEYLMPVLIPSFVGYVITLVLFLNNTQYLPMISMMFALSAFLITFLYVFWYSNNNRKSIKALTNNMLLPEFTVKDSSGNDIQSHEFKGKKALIFFYRGNWCPLCMAQIKEVAAQYKKFEDNNINVIFIAPQSPKNTQDLANKFNLSFKFYLDENNRAAKKLGIEHKFGLPMGFQALGYDSHSVYPTIIATDESGTIIYNDQTSNYRVRPEPEELFKIFF